MKESSVELEKYILGYKHHCYEDILALCKLSTFGGRKLSTLEGRRRRGDLIQVFKLLNGLEQISYNNFFVLDVNTSWRSHTLKVAKPRARIDCIVLPIESLIVGIIIRLKS